MCRFVKFIPSEKSEFLRKNHPNSFLLLSLIAERARRTSDNFDGLQIGDAILGDFESAGLTRKQYRNSLENLVELGFIKIIYNGKKFLNDEKRAIKMAIKGTLVNLIDSSIWDINAEGEGQQKGQQGANKGPTRGHEQERTRKNKKEKETTTPPNPQRGDRVVVLYDCLKENKDLNDDEKEFLHQFPENRVKLALDFAKTEKPNTTLIQMLIWHCKERIPPRPSGKRLTDQQRMAIEFNLYLNSIGQELLYHENLKNIEDGSYILIPLNGCPTPISLRNSLNILKNDFEEVKSQQRKLKLG